MVRVRVAPRLTLHTARARVRFDAEGRRLVAECETQNGGERGEALMFMERTPGGVLEPVTPNVDPAAVVIGRIRYEVAPSAVMPVSSHVRFVAMVLPPERRNAIAQDSPHALGEAFALRAE